MLFKDSACFLTTPCNPHHPWLACFAPANAALLTKPRTRNAAAPSSARRAGSRDQRTTCLAFEEMAGPRIPVTQFGDLKANGTVATTAIGASTSAAQRRRHRLVTQLRSAGLKRCRRPARGEPSSTRFQDGPMRLTEPRTGHRKVAQDSSGESRCHRQRYGSGHRFVARGRRAAPFGHRIEPVACSRPGVSLPSSFPFRSMRTAWHRSSRERHCRELQLLMHRERCSRRGP